jgi:hypothetical protein
VGSQAGRACGIVAAAPYDAAKAQNGPAIALANKIARIARALVTKRRILPDSAAVA